MVDSSGEWLPSKRTRLSLGRRLGASSGAITTAAASEMASRHPWFTSLDADKRASITLVVQAGVEGFIRWFTRGDLTVTPDDIFAAAPRALTRAISLQQTVDLIRATIQTVERSFLDLPAPERTTLQTAMLHYSREIAFDVAGWYARAAESRGAWDARIEALVMDAVLRGEADESAIARASTLGWGSPTGIAVVIGDLSEQPGAVEALRTDATRAGLDVLAAPQGARLAVLMGGNLHTDDDAVAMAALLVEHFGPGPVVVGPVVRELARAVGSARAAMSGRRAAPAWPQAPRPCAAGALLPERALAGAGHARRHLAQDVYGQLAAHPGDLLVTLEAWFDEGASVEGTARRLFVHPNTVRYRLGRIEDVTGYAPQEPRDAYALRLALTLGRLFG